MKVIEVEGIRLTEEVISILKEWQSENQSRSEYFIHKLDEIMDFYLASEADFKGKERDLIDIITMLRWLSKDINALSLCDGFDSDDDFIDEDDL